MKRFAIPLLLALMLAAGCQSGAPDMGSVDKAKVELVGGKAKTVDILTFNDFHGSLAEEPKGKNMGIAKMATVFMDARKANPNTLILSGGDIYQGSALSSITKGTVVNEYLRYIGLAASTVGNHEFDWGPQYFAKWAEEGQFRFVVANVIDKATGKPVAWATPYAMFKVGGRKIAVVGFATQETLTKAKAEFLVGLDFQDPAKVAAALVPTLRKTEKPDVVIALTHIPSVADKDPTKALGMAELFELDALAKVPGIDAIVTAHSHNTVAGKVNGIPVVQGYYNGRTLGKLAIVFDEKGGFVVTPSYIESYKTKDKIAEDAIAKKIYTDYDAKFGGDLKAVVAKVDGELTHTANTNVTPMGKWVCDAMKARYGVQIVAMNGGGLRKGFVAGDAKISDFWELMPFDNYTVTFKTTGKTVKEIIAHGIDSKDFGNGQFSGVKVKYDPAATGAAKILEITLDDGTPVTDDGMYSVATNDFQFTGGDKYVMMKPNAKDVKETFEPVRDVLIEAGRKAGTIKIPSVEGIVTK